jgi:hypothetical protein
LDTNYARMVTVFKTDQYEGRLSYLDTEIKRVNKLKEKIVQINDLTYAKKV